uniref:Lysosomal membrane ascorbate-dependent ferrireductase CYB561A3 n=1 Tax=Hucho hucho TaxID=62062 RepID=A0A4W5MWZ8_9TELE
LTSLTAYYINTLFCTCLGALFFFNFCSVAISAVLYRFPLTWGQNKLPWMLLHAGVMLLALVCSVLGLCAVFDFHNSKDIPNLYSLDIYVPLPSHIKMNCYAIFYGCESILLLSIMSCISGINQKLFLPYANLPPEALVSNSLGVLIVDFGLVILKILSNQKWKRPEPTSWMS